MFDTFVFKGYNKYHGAYIYIQLPLTQDLFSKLKVYFIKSETKYNPAFHEHKSNHSDGCGHA